VAGEKRENFGDFHLPIFSFLRCSFSGRRIARLRRSISRKSPTASFGLRFADTFVPFSAGRRFVYYPLFGIYRPSGVATFSPTPASWRPIIPLFSIALGRGISASSPLPTLSHSTFSFFFRQQFLFLRRFRVFRSWLGGCGDDGV